MNPLTASNSTVSDLTSTTPIRSVLVANRGEIARRIFATARSMGLATVAVYTSQDADAPFVTEADKAIRLPEGYLDIDRIVAAGLTSGADAIHPGYGFLSENSKFARAVIGAGITWVGPSPHVIETMGDKIAAKAEAASAGVPILPSSNILDQYNEVGFPLLVKASAGGGGKGMKLVTAQNELAEAISSAQREAASAFGDDRVFLERYIPQARHVEIQILGDSHGNIIHLGERECSIQRRHQKIIEEAPSPRLENETRQAMAEAALRLGRAIGYQSAGTVEFLVDDATGDYFFLETNTRLQVEHPVTEEVTGLDLVRQQLLVAQGQRLARTQEQVVATGHAIEARIYAEDPANNFLPAAGAIETWIEPTSEGVRWDSGVVSGQRVSVDYDPMLAKVISHGPTRPEAAGLLARALEQLHLGGLTTNRDYLVAVLRSPQFLAGDTTTDFVDRVQVDTTPTSTAIELAAMAAMLWSQCRNRHADTVWGFAPSNWRNGGLGPSEISFRHGDHEPLTVRYRAERNGQFTATIGDVDRTLELVDANTNYQRGQKRGDRPDADFVEFLVDGERQRHLVTESSTAIHVQVDATTVSLKKIPRFTVPGSELPAGGLVAPMPGVVTDIRCTVGDDVVAGQVLVVLEAMKMEHHVKAPTGGTVTAVPITVGAQLDSGVPLVIIERSDEPEGNDENHDG